VAVAIGASRRLLEAAMVVLWLGAVGTGTAWLWRYKATPGPQASAPPTWPEGSKVVRSPGRPMLVMLAHPHCPCTRASLTELTVLMSRFHGRLDATVLFLRPAETGDDWQDTELWRRARAIPGVTALVDEQGAEAARFGGRVSGQVLLYDGGGRLAFHGGLTGARGHEGDNEGLRRVTALLEGRSARAESPVFGCSLHDPEAVATR
jgi:hypothetical protein